MTRQQLLGIRAVVLASKESSMEQPKEIAGHLAAAIPSATSLVLWLNDITINHILALASIGFILLQAAYLIWTWIREAQKL